ncbi:MAG: ATP-binding cassette domain-containing protein [Thermotogota bacterium]|nr:ATP-binding cassette domain-containing protein [Thermotogota bacterium]
MIRIEELSKRFGSKTVLNNISLNIKEGEIFAFVGPNGAGKLQH